MEAILGGGPLQSPGVYERPRPGESLQARLKLGVSSDLNFKALMAKLSATPRPVDLPSVESLPKRDLPRAACPFRPTVIGTTADYSMSMPDVSIADLRNDDNVIVGQITVLFHIFYNRLVDRVREAANKPAGGMSLDDEILTIDAARRFAIDIYRDIIVQDYLRHMLWPDVLKMFQSGTLLENEAGLPKGELTAVPLEFSHAAFRFGHVMIRPDYVLNEVNSDTAATRTLLALNSQREPSSMPLATRWLVQWSKFFALSDQKTPNFSLKIAPFYSSAMFSGSDFAVSGEPALTGLHNLDLQRGASVSLRSVESILKRLRALPSTKGIVNATRFLSDPKLRAETIRTWLEFQDERKQIGFAKNELDLLSKDPPLLFFVLFEAAAVAGGRSLGPVGSMIVGETMFRALSLRRAGAAPANALLADGSLETAIFKGKRPTTMPDLIRFVAEDSATQLGPIPFI